VIVFQPISSLLTLSRNAVELIVSILALIQGQVLIVQTSLIGSILSNLLLVLGMCFFFGGINRVEQFFNVTVAQTAASLLALAIGSLIIPTSFHLWAQGSAQAKTDEVTALSRGVSVLLLIVYGAYLFFQLKTHTDMYNEPSKKVGKRRTRVKKGDASKVMVQGGANMSAATGGEVTQENHMQHEDDDTDKPQLSIWVAIITLAVSTAFVAICAEFMVDSINALTEGPNGISKTFVGLILLPIVGNAAEHATAVTVACKDKMDLAIGVAVGSSLQIALFVLPFIVIVGWIMGNSAMNLSFDGFQVAVLFVAVLLGMSPQNLRFTKVHLSLTLSPVNYLIADGKSHWLEGCMLQILYLIIAIAAVGMPSHTTKYPTDCCISGIIPLRNELETFKSPVHYIGDEQYSNPFSVARRSGYRDNMDTSRNAWDTMGYTDLIFLLPVLRTCAG